MQTSKHLVLKYGKGQMTFRHVNFNAGLENVFDLAEAINGLQADAAESILLVTVERF